MPTKRQQLLLRWGSLSAAVALLLAVLVFVGRPGQEGFRSAAGIQDTGVTSVLRRETAADRVRLRFDEVRASAGIEFRHFPATRSSLLPEDMGSGLAWGDYDDDGDPDLFLVNFRGAVPGGPGGDRRQGRHALFRNDGEGRFVDVTERAGLARPTFGQAAAWGDYDNDGDLDLYVTNYGANLLYRNEGDGRFADVTGVAGVAGDSFSAGCAWADYDNDGHIDLYVTNYVAFDARDIDRTRVSRQYGAEIPYTINPSSYPPAANHLYRNNGDGSFSDVAATAGVANPDGRSLGALWFDFDNDGLLDLYVANDVSANGVYHNRGDGTFADIGASSLTADYRGAMGLAAGDYDGDGDPDLFVSHWIAQENAFFENMVSEGLRDARGEPRLFFVDVAEAIGLGQISLRTVGWAAGLVDLDNDGYLDLWVVNGNTLETAEDSTLLKPQRMHLFQHEPGRGFFEVGPRAGDALSRPVVGRGGAHADYDGDGRIDIAVAVHGGSPLLLHNVSAGSNHWLGLRLRQRGGNTRAIGARVLVRTETAAQSAQLVGGGSYLSQHQGDLHFGLGAAERVQELTVFWPDGSSETHAAIEPDQVLQLTHPADYSKRGR